MNAVMAPPKHKPGRRLGRAGLVLAAVAATLLMSPFASAQAVVHTGDGQPTEFPPRPAAPTVDVGASPFGIVIDHRTGSVYVADGSGVAVINGALCNARVVVGCERTPIAVPAGNGGIGIALDETTDTVYVANGADDTVSVVDAATCNAVITGGCAAGHPAIRVGSLPSHLAIDVASRTLYVANEGADAPGNTVSMIDMSVCNGHVTAGCGLAAPTATTGAGPDGLTIDARTHTLYVSNGADSTVSVIDTARCNSRVHTGCLATAPTLRLAGASVGGVLDATTHTLFEPTSNSMAGGDAPGILSIIDTSTCNAGVFTGCGQTPRQEQIGSGPIDAAEDPLTRRVYVVNEEDSDVSVVDIARCNAVHSDGCHRSSPTMSIGFDGGAVAVDPTTDTIYGSSQDRGTVTVLDGASCTDTHSTGCRHPAPTTVVGAGPAGGTLVDATGTLYVANQQTNTVSIIDTRACNSGHLLGCHRSWPTITVGEFPMTVAADEALDTLYVPNLNSSTVSVINARTCNAQTTAGCDQTAGTVSVSGGAYTLTVEPQTQTVYVANVDSDTVSIINARTCNARINQRLRPNPGNGPDRRCTSRPAARPVHTHPVRGQSWRPHRLTHRHNQLQRNHVRRLRNVTTHSAAHGRSPIHGHQPANRDALRLVQGRLKPRDDRHHTMQRTHHHRLPHHTAGGTRRIPPLPGRHRPSQRRHPRRQRRRLHHLHHRRHGLQRADHNRVPATHRHHRNGRLAHQSHHRCQHHDRLRQRQRRRHRKHHQHRTSTILNDRRPDLPGLPPTPVTRATEPRCNSRHGQGHIATRKPAAGGLACQRFDRHTARSGSGNPPAPAALRA